MRSLVNVLAKQYFRWRGSRLDEQKSFPHAHQKRVFQQLVAQAQHTEWGKNHEYSRIKTAEDFARQVPLQDYESLKPFIHRMMMGEANILWPGVTRWFSKSSGTTNDKSKFIPVSLQNLQRCHLKGSRDTLALLYQNRPDSNIFSGKSMIMGGSLEPFAQHPSTQVGDVSAIMLHHMPLAGRPFFFPDFETALLSHWEEKLEKMAQAAVREKDMVMIGGVPTWVVVLFRKMLELTGKQSILEIWPRFETYIHGGVSFTPYREQFKNFFPSDRVNYLEVYNATEGYFATQENLDDPGLMLFLDNGMYYEFIPAEEVDNATPRAITLEEVELGRDYALVVSTNSGLWRYIPGDMVRFTSQYPYKILITGRTKQYVNAFGEEVMVANTDLALSMTCQEFGAIVTEYTVAPVFFEGNEKGRHEWIVEFELPPANIPAFRSKLDQNLQRLNSDYEAKRYRSMALDELMLNVVEKGTFYRWMKSRGKFGGQHKVPRLANHRRYVDEVKEFCKNHF